jgi:hypothetical protein
MKTTRLAACLWPILALAGCGGNNAPDILTFNGAEVKTDFWGQSYLDQTFDFAPGDVIPFRVHVIDPDGDNVQIWFPKAPLGFEFPPDGSTGTWSVPVDFDESGWDFVVVAVDDAPEPAGTTLQVGFGDWDSGRPPKPF